MNIWLGIASGAYLIGAAIEGVSSANQLLGSVSELTDPSNNPSSELDESPRSRWQLFTAITTVSLCGAVFWPCRLLHRSIKREQNPSSGG